MWMKVVPQWCLQNLGAYKLIQGRNHRIVKKQQAVKGYDAIRWGKSDPTRNWDPYLNCITQSTSYTGWVRFWPKGREDPLKWAMSGRPAYLNHFERFDGFDIFVLWVPPQLNSNCGSVYQANDKRHALLLIGKLMFERGSVKYSNGLPYYAIKDHCIFME